MTDKPRTTIKKRRKITYRLAVQTEVEKRLGIQQYEIYPADYDAALASLRAAEARGEVTDIEIEE